MKSISFHKEQGISIRLVNIVMFVLALIASIMLFFAMRRTTNMYNESNRITQNTIELQNSANELMEASDYLTQEMQVFVVTGDRQHLDNYFNEAYIERRRDKALEELRSKNGKTMAYQNLQEAMDDSMELMNTELYAAKLAVIGYGYNLESFPVQVQNAQIKKNDLALSKEAKIRMAEDLMFDENYMAKKDSISKHIDSCLNDLMDEMNAKQQDMTNRVRKQVWFEHFLTWFLIVITLMVVLLTAKLIIVPIKKAVERIREEKDIPLSGAYEVRFLAKTYNLMYQTNVVNKEKLNYEATHDKLTGLYNRRGYEFLLSNVDMESATLLILDLDKFKQINDMYGHDMGDKVLIKTADVIYNSFRSQDYVCRIGGDEFAVIMVHCNSTLKELIERKVEIMNDKMQNAIDGVPAITVSVGAAFGEDGHSVDRIFKSADEALYNAKQSGSGRIKFAKS
ncbi:MAG: GGDEF domain-containing protein [Lachnospiraceae bacterium]|nr:GGDEF domain-containing protein [Lachnospiraceae bacterium]